MAILLGKGETLVPDCNIVIASEIQLRLIKMSIFTFVLAVERLNGHQDNGLFYNNVLHAWSFHFLHTNFSKSVTDYADSD